MPFAMITGSDGARGLYRPKSADMQFAALIV